MTILMGAVAMAIALICLLFGYRWGRSKLRSQIEEAIEKERISLDAREFTLREQLDDQMAELVELRARAEELARQQQPLEQLRRKQIRESERIAQSQEKPEDAPKAVVESTDVTIQKLLKSIEDNLRQSVAEPPKAAEPAKQESQKPEPIAKPESKKPEQESQKPEPVSEPESKKPEQINSSALSPSPIVEDDWQEFASSLAALTRRKQ